MNKEYDYLFKLVIIGNSGVGKSSLLLRFADDKFSDSYLATIGVDFRFKTLKLEDHNVKLQIWDTAGQEKFRTITNAYYKGADGIIVVYDSGDSTSFNDIENYWHNEIVNFAEPEVQIMILGNKSDNEEKEVTGEQGDNYSKSKNMLFYETSAKTSDKVEEAFLSLTKILVDKKKNERKVKKEKLNNMGIKDSPTKASSETVEPQKITIDNQKEKKVEQTDCHRCWK